MTPNRRKSSEQMRESSQRKHRDAYHHSDTIFNCRHDMCVLAVRRVMARYREELDAKAKRNSA